MPRPGLYSPAAPPARGKYKAVVAIAHSVLVSIYHMLRDKRLYADLGPDSFGQLDAARLQRHHVHRLEQLGYTVTLHPLPLLDQAGTGIYGRIPS